LFIVQNANMKTAIALFTFILLPGATFCQSNVKQNLAKQINEFFLSSIDSNQIVNIDRLGTINIMYKDKDENVDFNILDLSKLELIDDEDENPSLGILFHCRNCMHLTSPSAERRAKFDNNTLRLPIKYKALGVKLIDKLEELKKQNR